MNNSERIDVLINELVILKNARKYLLKAKIEVTYSEIDIDDITNQFDDFTNELIGIRETAIKEEIRQLEPSEPPESPGNLGLNYERPGT